MQSELPSAYLELFKELKNPPKKLYYKGNLKLLEQRKIAIIGSRRMSTYTKNCVFELSNLLKNSKISVVSEVLWVLISVQVWRLCQAL